MQATNQKISLAYKSAVDFAKTHYENFPVVSLLIPKELRRHVAIIYWFARTADDIADEGTKDEKQRLIALNEFEESLTDLLVGKYKSPSEEALHLTIEEMKLSSQLFYDLITAFKQDVVKKRYQNFSEVLDYCKYSANPVGRLILELVNCREEKAFLWSDKICTALQLTNFYQDVEIDFEKGRIYFALDEINQFGVTEKTFAARQDNLNMRKLLEYNVNRTQVMFDEGKKLLGYLKGRIKIEIKWTILGGEAILNKLRENDFKIFNARPRLTKKDFGALFIKSIFSY